MERPPSKSLRVLARALVRCSVSRLRSRDYWRVFLERQLEEIAGDIRALIWAAGCLWSLRVERLIARAPPVVNCALFLAGLYVGVNILLPHLIWYGVPRTSLDFGGDAHRVFLKVALFLAVVAVVGMGSPGSARRRIFAACMFPLVGMLAMLATELGMGFADCIRISECPVAEALLRGLALGLLIAALLSLPTALLYRRSAVPVAILSVLPSIAKVDAGVAHSQALDNADILFWHLGPYLCALTIVALSTYACDRFLSAPLDPGRGRP